MSLDAKVEAEALRRLQVHLDHVSLATLLQTFLDSNANLAFPKTAFWRNAQFQNAQLCHRPPPERNNLAASLNTLTQTTQKWFIQQFFQHSKQKQ